MDPRLAEPATLYPDECAIVAAAVERRQREFAAGRILARGLLESLGHTGPLGRTADGPPRWPTGVLGSITHCGSMAAAAVSRTDACVGLGIDLEVRRPLPTEVADLVLTPAERGWIAAQDPDRCDALHLFCAKEALYKAIYPLVRDILDFAVVTITPTDSERSFSAEFNVAAGPFRPGDRLPGRWKASDTYVAASVVIEAAPGAVAQASGPPPARGLN